MVALAFRLRALALSKHPTDKAIRARISNVDLLVIGDSAKPMMYENQADADTNNPNLSSP